MHLVGFIIRIYHDARSHERQILYHFCCLNIDRFSYQYNKQDFASSVNLHEEQTQLV